MNTISKIIAVLVLLFAVDAQAACVKTNAERTCTQTLTWTAPVAGPVLGYIMQRQISGGEWLDLSARPTEPTMIDVVTDTVGGQTINYRVLAYNAVGRSEPSNVATVVTPGAGINIVTDKQVLISRRGESGSTIIPILVNPGETVTINGVVQ